MVTRYLYFWGIAKNRNKSVSNCHIDIFFSQRKMPRRETLTDCGCGRLIFDQPTDPVVKYSWLPSYCEEHEKVDQEYHEESSRLYSKIRRLERKIRELEEQHIKNMPKKLSSWFTSEDI